MRDGRILHLELRGDLQIRMRLHADREDQIDRRERRRDGRDHAHAPIDRVEERPVEATLKG